MSSLIASRDQEPERQPDEHDDEADAEVERLLHRPVGTGEHGRLQLEERHALAGHVLAALQQQLRRLRRDSHAHAVAVGRLDEVEHRLLVHTALTEDDLVRPHLFEPSLERAVPSGRERADELVREHPPLRGQHALEQLEMLALADEQHAAPDAQQPLQLERQRLVGGAQAADRERRGDAAQSGSGRTS